MNAWGFALLGEACARTGATTYAGVWRASLGPRYAAVPAVASLFLTFTASVACLSVIADGATDLCSALTGIDYFALPRDAILVALVGAVLTPICSLRSLAPLATPSKIGVVGTVVAVDALSHLPVLGALVPGPAEFIGAVAATLLAARYVVTKEATPEEDLAAFGSTLPGEFPPADFGAAFAPVAALAKKAGDADLDALQEDLAKAPEAVQKWFGDLENPVETIAPPAAALGAAVLVGQVANFPVLALVFPRLLELAGVATVVQAVNKYGGEEGGSLKEDLAKVAARGGDAVKALAGKK